MLNNMTPSAHAKQLIFKFYEHIGFYPQAKQCALLHVDLMIGSLYRNIGYTQCSIDLGHYQDVKREIEKEIKAI